MPETARILRFPKGRSAPEVLSPQEAAEAARSYLETAVEDRTELTSQLLSNPDVLWYMCVVLRDLWETSPATVSEEASRLYAWIADPKHAFGLFDERDYFLGETALIAGTAYRFVGKLDEAERWLDRADAGFRHTVNPAPLLANVAYARISVRYVAGEYRHVLELLPSLAGSFRKLNMELETAKCWFLEAKALIQLGRLEESLPVLTSLRESQAVRRDSGLFGRVLVHLGNYYGGVGQFDRAAEIYEEALPAVTESGKPAVVAELKWSIGDTYRSQHQLTKAVEAYRGARKDFEAIAMGTYVALLRLVTAETLLSVGRPREAEWEILAALPTIEEQKMVPEGFAAVALLRESARRRQTDADALRELREHLQANRA
jgi:tetratricopeptide (TPR) repeat protein